MGNFFCTSWYTIHTQCVIVSNEHIKTESPGGEAVPVRFEPSTHATSSDSPVRFLELPTPYGRCYELVTELPFRSSEYISLAFNMSTMHGRKLPLYLYENGIIGLMGNYWVRFGLSTL